MKQQLHSIIKISVLAWLLPTTAVAQDVTNKILNQLAHEESIKIDDVTPENKQQVILGIKNFLKEKHARGSMDDAMKLLVTLKDDETIQKLVNQYHSDFSKGGDILYFSANSEIIPFVASDLSLPKDAGRKLVGDIYVPPTRVWAAQLILRCIANSPDFPAQIQSWARSSSGFENDDWSRVQQWWIHNKDAVLAKRYQDATWLPPIAAK